MLTLAEAQASSQPAWLRDRNFWQIAAGDARSSHAEVCFKWSVIFQGPGYAGSWPDCVPRLVQDGWSKRTLSNLKRFAEDVKLGDLVVLHAGSKHALGVGEVVGPYSWHRAFLDAGAHDLGHLRRVRWLWQTRDKGKPPELPFNQTLGLRRLDSQPVKRWLATLPLAESPATALPELPADDGDCLTPGAVADFLYSQGISPDSIGRTLKVIAAVRQHAYAYRRGNLPPERETLAHMVLPLFQALGWTPQQMALEWNRMDLALFRCLPRTDENLEMVVEVKRLYAPNLMTAARQAERYARHYPSCHRLVVTDGVRYGVYQRERDSFALYTYMNLAELRKNYPLYECNGAKETLLAIALTAGLKINRTQNK